MFADESAGTKLVNAMSRVVSGHQMDKSISISLNNIHHNSFACGEKEMPAN